MNLMMKKIRWLAVLILSISNIACIDKPQSVTVPIAEVPLSSQISLDVYKSLTCSCCEKWVTHITDSGFVTAVHHPTDLNQLKINLNISSQYQSCHTAVSSNGYVFEGHIPAYIIQRFLADPPDDALGLAVPGMPIGSPGMEMGNRYDKYDVLILSKAGGSKIFEHVVAK
mgnify:CR=1 FL=1|tara:strand:- start:4776 stop:5285 length:510 start_codon:yes stop_codon:yes gene_type:complete